MFIFTWVSVCVCVCEGKTSKEKRFLKGFRFFRKETFKIIIDNKHSTDTNVSIHNNDNSNNKTDDNAKNDCNNDDDNTESK